MDYDTTDRVHTVMYDDGTVTAIDHDDRQNHCTVVHLPAETPKKLAPWAPQIIMQLKQLFHNPTTPTASIIKVAELIFSSLADNTVTNYTGKLKRFFNFCTTNRLQPLPASQTTALLYIRDWYDCPTIAVESFQPYLSAANSMHADLGFDAPLVGHLVNRAKKGAAHLQNTKSDDTSRYWIPASAVSDVLTLALRFPDAMDPHLL